MAYIKNWTDNFFQIFFMGTSWVPVSEKWRHDKFFYFNGVNVVKHWHVAGDVFAISDCLVLHCISLDFMYNSRAVSG